MTYKVTIEVDQEWFDILGKISQNQEGFVWIGARYVDEV